MKQILIVFIAAGALIIAFGGEGRDQTGEAAWSQGVETVDRYVSEGLSEQTHDTLSEQVSGTSVWVKSFGDKLERMTQ